MKNRILRSAFPIVASALGDKFGVKISIGGGDAYTDGKSINLPAYNGEDKDYKDVAWGYLAHEAGHLRFTDMEQFANAATSPIRKHLVNILEDIRIEKSMQGLYPGTRLTTEKVVGHMIASGGFSAPGDQEEHPAKALGQHLLYGLRDSILGQTALKAYADKAEENLERIFPPGAETRLFGLLSEVPTLQNTRDCVRLADRILRMIEEEEEKAQQASGDSQPQQGNGDPQGQPGGGDPQPQQGNGDPQGQPGDGDPQPQQGNGDPQPQQGNGDHATPEQLRALASVLSAGEGDVDPDVFDAAKQLLGAQPSAVYDDIAMPAESELLLDAEQGRAVLDRALKESGFIRTSLQGLVQSSANKRPIHKRSGIRIDGRRLSRLAVGDSRIFDRRAEKQAPNTAFHLLVDGSPSMKMQADKDRLLIDIALESAVALALALEGIPGVNPAITRFPTKRGVVSTLLLHGQKVRQRTAAYVPYGTGSTPLAQALWFTAASILRTKEERKTIVVLTDGKPDNLEQALEIIRRCEALGIETYGIGICYDVSHMFGKAIRVDDVSQLRAKLFELGRDLLLEAA